MPISLPTTSSSVSTSTAPVSATAAMSSASAGELSLSVHPIAVLRFRAGEPETLRLRLGTRRGSTSIGPRRGRAATHAASSQPVRSPVGGRRWHVRAARRVLPSSGRAGSSVRRAVQRRGSTGRRGTGRAFRCRDPTLSGGRVGQCLKQGLAAEIEPALAGDHDLQARVAIEQIGDARACRRLVEGVDDDQVTFSTALGADARRAPSSAVRASLRAARHRGPR